MFTRIQYTLICVLYVYIFMLKEKFGTSSKMTREAFEEKYRNAIV